MTTDEQLINLRKTAVDLATALCSNTIPCVLNKGESCIKQEHDRALTFAERKKGWAFRPFSALDPRRLCTPCAAYWHATMASLCLDELVRKRERDAAR